MSWSVAPCLDQLLHEINTLAPNRSKAADGSIGDTAHSARRSDHNPDVRGIVHARDFTHDPAHGADMNVLSEEVKRDPRVKYVIWNRRIWNPSVSRSWRPYTGTNPHNHHMHVSVLSGERFENDVSPWLDGQEDEMTPAQEAKLDRVVALLGENKAWPDELSVRQMLIETIAGKPVDGVKEILKRLDTIDERLAAIESSDV